MNDRIWKTAINKFELRVGLPKGFVYALAQDDDWAFIIKVHALYETVLTEVLTTTLGNNKLKDVFAEISMADKIKLASACDLFDKEDRNMLHSLSSLRNKLVHSVSQIDFSFSLHLKKPNRRKNFLKSFSHIWPDPVILPGDIQVPREEFIIENPKLTVWAWCQRIVANILLEDELRQFRSEETSTYREVAEIFFKLVKTFQGNEHVKTAR